MAQQRSVISTMDSLKADIWRIYGGFTGSKLMLATLTNRTFRVILTLRLCQASTRSKWGKLFLPLCKILHHFSSSLAGMDLPWKTTIGPGIALAHGWGIVVNAEARIGKNVTLFHGVTLGRRDKIMKDGQRHTEYPILEDEVWVGPNVIIVGGVTIGRGSRIGGGAFVTESVPPYSIVQGNPSLVVKSNCVPDVMNPAPV